jgi:hypothetical protein
VGELLPYKQAVVGSTPTAPIQLVKSESRRPIRVGGFSFSAMRADESEFRQRVAVMKIPLPGLLFFVRAAIASGVLFTTASCNDQDAAGVCPQGEPCSCESGQTGFVNCQAGVRSCVCSDIDVVEDVAVDTSVPDVEVPDTQTDSETTPDVGQPDADATVEPDVEDTDVILGDRNRCGGTTALQWLGEAASPGDACGAGELFCNGINALQCLGELPANACGGVGLLSGTPGEPCGFCGEGVWVCDGEDVSCVGELQPNGCGGCTLLEAQPGSACVVLDEPGVWVCDGAGAVVCLPDVNACGGPGELLWNGVAAQPGEPCDDACGGGTLECTGGGGLTCIGNGLRNACGGCAELDGVLGEPCGVCGGEWQCLGANSIICSDSPDNVCGGCAFSALVPGSACAGGVVVCAGDEPACATGPVNDCGLPGANVGAGVACGDDCADGYLRCGADGGVCVGESVRDECGTCRSDDPAIGSPCGLCGEGSWACGGDGAECVIDPSVERNACNGCSRLLAEPGDACGTCGQGTFVCAESDDSVSCNSNAGDANRNACGGCATLAAEPGDSCGPCGLDEWTCNGPEAVRCNGETAVNDCGGCDDLPETVGGSCGACDAGEWVCEGTDAVVCDDANALNGCGTCAPLEDEPGEPCGICDTGEWACEPDGLSLTCEGNAGVGALNACGGCNTLTQVPGTECGTCGVGRWTCTPERDNVVCLGDLGESARNRCGGCEDLPSEPGFLCDPCGFQLWECDGSDALVCNATVERNACGGCTPSPLIPGEPCNNGSNGICREEGEIFCADGTPVCNADIGNPPLPIEFCNNEDDDCDGATDEGFDLAGDENNCGTCGVTCSDAQAESACVSGACTLLVCDEGWADVDGDVLTGCEACAPGVSGSDCEVSCSNAIRDLGETTVDCGGICSGCSLGVSLATGGVTPVDLDARLGSAMAVDRGVLLVGASNETVSGVDRGAVHVFLRTAVGTWTASQRISPPTLRSGDRFGASVAIDGAFAAVGAPGRDSLGSDAGIVWVLEQTTPGNWEAVQQLVAPDGASGHVFGTAVDISGDRIVVGAPGASSPGRVSDGRVYVFRRQEDRIWRLEASLIAAAGRTGDGLGTSVSLDGELLVAGAPLADDIALNAGAVEVWTWPFGVWTSQQRLVPPALLSDDRFGVSLALDNERLVVGQPGADARGANSGAARLFQWDGDSMSQRVQLLPPTGSTGFEFGFSVAVDGDRVVVGVPGDNTAAARAGSAHVWELAEDWTFRVTLVLPSAVANDRLGTSVTAGSGVIVLGAPQNDVQGRDTGRLLIVE